MERTDTSQLRKIILLQSISEMLITVDVVACHCFKGEDFEGEYRLTQHTYIAFWTGRGSCLTWAVNDTR